MDKQQVKEYENELDQDITCSEDNCECEPYEDGLCERHYEESICEHIDTEKMDYGEVRCLSCGLEFGEY